ncbi:MAG TPA: biotin/lipoyl-containing protein, partial [Rhodopila sp.]|nr:biotin/lipoyl-containing protein [Rhodopila sp.]
HRIVSHPDFSAGGIDTGFIAREADTLLAGQGTPSTPVLASAVLAVLAAEAHLPVSAGDPYSPWNERDLWWVNASPRRVLEFFDGSEIWPVSVTREGTHWRLQTSVDSILGAAVPLPDGQMRVSINGAWHVVLPHIDGHVVTLRWQGATWRLSLLDRLEAADEEEDSADRLVAPIPGQVTQVAVSAGDSVERGQVLVVLEAMKTVFRLAAPADKVVAEVSCAVGEMVQEGQLLVSFKVTEG